MHIIQGYFQAMWHTIDCAALLRSYSMQHHDACTLKQCNSNQISVDESCSRLMSVVVCVCMLRGVVRVVCVRHARPPACAPSVALVCSTAADSAAGTVPFGAARVSDRRRFVVVVV